MRDPKRIRPTLNRIASVWAQYPDLRLGQLLANAVYPRDIFYIEDNELIERLEAFSKEIDNLVTHGSTHP